MIDNKVLPIDDLLKLDLPIAKKALAQTREGIGKERTLDLFKEEINKGNSMWERIAANSREQVNYQRAYVEVEVKGITLIQFLMFNQELMKKNNLYMPSTIHPEHYYFDADRTGRQVIIETFGMYKDPSYLDLKPGNKNDYPVKPDENIDIVIAGRTYLKTNDIDTKLIGMHQLTRTPNGMKVKLGVFLPEGAPKEIAEGHKWHLMVEFNNGLHYAAKQRPTFIQKIIFGVAIRRLKRKNR